jgi:hypothetical protein
MPSEAEYRYCARLGMSQAECAAHLGISRAAVTKAKARLGLTFGEGMALSQGRQWEMEFFRYPWEKMDVGDWIEVPSYPAVVAYRANLKHAPRRFVAVTRDHSYAVLRAA